LSGVNVFWVAQHTLELGYGKQHTHDFYQLTAPLFGSMLVNEEIIVKPKHLMLAKPGQKHAFFAAKEDDVRSSIVFDSKFSVTDPEIHAALQHIPFCFSVELDAIVWNLMKNIISEATKQEPFYQQNIDSYMETILITLIRQFSPKTHERIRQIELLTEGSASTCKGIHAAQIRTYIDTNIDKIFSLDDLTDYLHTNKTTLIDTFKTMFGLTPMRYVNHRRMEIAKDMLLHTKMSISEISSCVGFQSIHYFSKAFKEHEGISPLNFRDQSKDHYIPLPHSTEQKGLPPHKTGVYD